MVEMSDIREKKVKQVDLLTNLYMLRSTDAMRAVSDFCNFMIDELRQENDTVAHDRLDNNQGKIEAFKMIVDAINTGSSVLGLRKKNN
jgi:hypothetical protein